MPHSDLARPLHYGTPVHYLGLLSIDSGPLDNDCYDFCLKSLSLVPTPTMHDLDSFPHQLYGYGYTSSGYAGAHLGVFSRTYLLATYLTFPLGAPTHSVPLALWVHSHLPHWVIPQHSARMTSSHVSER